MIFKDRRKRREKKIVSARHGTERNTTPYLGHGEENGKRTPREGINGTLAFKRDFLFLLGTEKAERRMTGNS